MSGRQGGWWPRGRKTCQEGDDGAGECQCFAIISIKSLQINRCTYLFAFSALQPLRSNNRKRWDKEQWHHHCWWLRTRRRRSWNFALARSFENGCHVPQLWPCLTIAAYRLMHLGVGNRMGAGWWLNTGCWRRNSRGSYGSKRWEGREEALCSTPRF